MSDEHDFIHGREFYGALMGVRVTLADLGLKTGDELCVRVAAAVLTGFTIAGGLEPASLDVLRQTVAESKISRSQ